MGSAESKVRSLPEIDEGNDTSSMLEEVHNQPELHQHNRHSLTFTVTIPLLFDPKPYYDKLRKPSVAVVSAITKYVRPEPCFPFLELPAELRLMVYEELLVVGKVFYKPTAYEIRNGSRFDGYDRFRIPELQLLRVCKQIHAEAEPVYLAKNLFVLPKDWPGTMAWTPARDSYKTFSISGKLHIRSISLSLDQHSFSEELEPVDAHFWSTAPVFEEGESFMDLSELDTFEIVHDVAVDHAYAAWARILSELEFFQNLRYVEIDITNAFCPQGHCRLVEIIEFWWTRKVNPTSIVIVGSYPGEFECDFIFNFSVKTLKEKYGLRLRKPGEGSSWDVWMMGHDFKAGRHPIELPPTT
jgi:hypothetical protein